MAIAAGDAGARAGGGGEGAAGEGAGAAHVVVDVDRCAEAAAAAAAEDEEVVAGGGSGCRICHLGDGELPAENGSGKLMRLGCSCRGELAAAHRRCAEAWFSVRGNRRCEICGEDATNITGWSGGGKEFMQQWHETAGMDGSGGSPKACGFCRSHSFCNLLIACLIIVFILPWFLHNHIVNHIV